MAHSKFKYKPIGLHLELMQKSAIVTHPPWNESQWVTKANASGLLHCWSKSIPHWSRTERRNLQAGNSGFNRFTSLYNFYRLFSVPAPSAWAMLVISHRSSSVTSDPLSCCNFVLYRHRWLWTWNCCIASFVVPLLGSRSPFLAPLIIITWTTRVISHHHRY